MISRIGVLSGAALMIAIAAVNGQSEDRHIVQARRVLELMKDERFVDVAKDFNAMMAAALSAPRLRDAWLGLRMQFGPVVSELDAKVVPAMSGITVVSLGTRFERALNHLFIEGEGKATPAEYARPGKVAEFVLDEIAGWIATVAGQ